MDVKDGRTFELVENVAPESCVLLAVVGDKNVFGFVGLGGGSANIIQRPEDVRPIQGLKGLTSISDNNGWRKQRGTTATTTTYFRMAAWKLITIEPSNPIFKFSESNV